MRRLLRIRFVTQTHVPHTAHGKRAQDDTTNTTIGPANRQQQHRKGTQPPTNPTRRIDHATRNQRQQQQQRSSRATPPHLAACAVAGFREPGVLEVLVVVRRAGRGVVAEGHLPRRRPEHRRKSETRTATTSPRSVRRQYAQQEKHERDERFVENCTRWRQPLSGAPIVARLIRTENR